MINVASQSQVRLSPHSPEHPYLTVSASQLDQLKKLLNENQIEFSVRDTLISMNDGPYIATIDFRKGADQDAIQAVLDSVN